MPNYQEQQITGAKWKRSHFVAIENPLVGEKAVNFYEQFARQTSDGQLTFEEAGSLRQAFSDPSVTFPLRSPVDDSLITDASGAPVTTTYQNVYVLLHSLYLHLASLRDNVVLPGATVPG